MGRYRARDKVIYAWNDPLSFIEIPGVCNVAVSDGRFQPSEIHITFTSQLTLGPFWRGNYICMTEEKTFFVLEERVFDAIYDPKEVILNGGSAEAKGLEDHYLELDRASSCGISFKCECTDGVYFVSVMDKSSMHVSSGFKTFADAVDWIVAMAKTCPEYKDPPIG